MDCSVNQNFSTITRFSTILTVHLVEKVILIIQMLSTILQVSTILQSTIAGFYCSLHGRGIKVCKTRNFKTVHFWAEDITYLRGCVNKNSYARRGLKILTNLVEVFTSWSWKLLNIFEIQLVVILIIPQKPTCYKISCLQGLFIKHNVCM